jgi:hypothetical protein
MNIFSNQTGRRRRGAGFGCYIEFSGSFTLQVDFVRKAKLTTTRVTASTARTIDTQTNNKQESIHGANI